uniref:Galectin n=1 Tax=Cyclopterus lumpus TaxID=8103 RepID=A0A8C3A4B0_CYCLU
MSNGNVCTRKLVSSILSTLSLPRISVLAPDPSLSPSLSSSSSSSSPPSQPSDALCGSCPSSGSAPQTNSLWPSPPWPGQPAQPVPCWTGQPNTPCWTGSQPVPVSAGPGQVAAPVQPCWPGTQCQFPQYQPTQYQPPQYQPTQYQPPQYQPPQYQPPQYLPPQYLPPQYQPTQYHVPYNLNLARGVYDKMMMTILGHVKADAKMFTVNFLRGKDIAFHINPRFNEGGKQALVRNHKAGERWGPEERDLKGPFPFALGSPFEMKILCTQETFRVAVDNVPLFEFRHRVRELNQIDRINILHDVVLTGVNVETLP